MAYRFKAYENMATYRFTEAGFTVLELSRNSDPGVAHVRSGVTYEIGNAAKEGTLNVAGSPTVGQAVTGTQRTRTGVR